MAVRTQKVINAHGVEERGVKVSEKNFVQVAEWVSKHSFKQEPVAIVRVDKGGAETNHRVKLRVPKAGIRVARVGDTIVRSVEGFFYVIKAASVKL